MKPLRLGVKYCGGCSPRYDRVEWVAALEKKMTHRVILVPYDDPQAEAILVVMGCESACVDPTPFISKPHFLFWRESQMEDFVQWIGDIGRNRS